MGWDAPWQQPLHSSLLHQPLHWFTALALEPWLCSLMWCGHIAQHPWPLSPFLPGLPTGQLLGS